MTDAEFIALALSLPATELATNHGRPALNVRGKIFAGPGEGRGGVAALKFSPEQQELFCEVEPAIFRPDPSHWGQAGWTSFILEAADEATARSALAAAWRNIAPKTLVAKHPEL
jgi:hypothetical protein